MDVRKREHTEISRDDSSLFDKFENAALDDPWKRRRVSLNTSEFGNRAPVANFIFQSSAPGSTAVSTPPGGLGFQAYTNINPFSNVENFSTNLNALNVLTDIPSAKSSPKSPNPFSAPSPAQNPFMNYVDSAKNLWSTVTAGSASSTDNSQNNIPIDAASATILHVPTPTSTSLKLPIQAVPSPAVSHISTYNRKSEAITNSATNVELKQSSIKDDDDSGVVDDYDAAESADPEEDTATGVYGKIYPLPENVPVITGEEGEECILLTRVKLYRLQVPKAAGTTGVGQGSSSGITASYGDDGKTTAADSVADWVEAGVGPVKILKTVAAPLAVKDRVDSEVELPHPPSSTSTVETSSHQPQHRLVMRRESSRGGPGTKLLLNLLLRSYVTARKVGDKMFRLTCLNSCNDANMELVPSTFLFKTKSTPELDVLLKVIQEAVSMSPLAAVKE